MVVKTSVALSDFDSNRMTDDEILAREKSGLLYRLHNEIDKYVKFRVYFSPDEHRTVVTAFVNIGGANE